MTWFTPPEEALAETRLLAYLVEHLEVVRSLSQDTVRARRVMLRRFMAWCVERGIDEPRGITRAVLKGYEGALQHYRNADGVPLDARTQLQCMQAVGGWLDWMAQARHIVDNPAADLHLPRATLSLADIERHNLHTLRCITRAALEDLEAVRLARGAPSLAYDKQVARAMILIEGHLEAVLTAALRDLDGR